jgi:glycosyltransferase involved in cell wall biosynthesis
VGFLGTLLEHKGARVAVDAVRSRPDLDVELRLYGGSFEQHEYERELREAAGGDSRILFAGSYEHDDLPGILAELDAVVIPSLWHENLPIAGLNAIASGVPLLVSDVGGLTELVDDYACGIAFRRSDAEDLGALLERLGREPGVLPGIRDRMASPPSVEEEAARVEALYEEATAGRAEFRAHSPSA